ncbi:PucR family transcriptional regulator [Bacillus gobiensis]|uniref:PucR family transcriptional regulator n=1 Tax=Bacillus gobiensis TaxID=1441095 RepID=UPI003D1BBD6C
MNELLERVYSILDLDKIIDLISFELKKPVIVESADFFLLAYNSYYINHYDLANQQTIFSKKCPLPIFEKFMEYGVIHKLKTIDTPFRVDRMEEIGLNPRVVVSAKHKDNIMGYIWIQEIETPMTESELEFLYHTSFQVGQIIHSNNKQKSSKKGEELYKKAILNQFESELKIREEAVEAGVKLPVSFSVMVLQAPGEYIEDVKKDIQSYLNLKNDLNRVLIAQSRIVSIIGGSASGHSTESTALDVIAGILDHIPADQRSAIFIGIGNEYSDVMSFHRSYLEALEVIKAADLLGSQTNIPYEFEKLGIYRYLDFIATKNKELNYVNKELQLLKEKDRDGKKEFLKTLEVYLLNDCKIKPTSEQLFIHPNTLNYRMKKIMEYTSLDVKDFKSKCQWLLDLMLMKNESGK